MEKNELAGKTYVKVWRGGDAENFEWCGLCAAFRKTSVIAHLDKNDMPEALEQVDNKYIVNAISAPQP